MLEDRTSKSSRVNGSLPWAQVALVWGMTKSLPIFVIALALAGPTSAAAQQFDLHCTPREHDDGVGTQWFVMDLDAGNYCDPLRGGPSLRLVSVTPAAIVGAIESRNGCPEDCTSWPRPNMRIRKYVNGYTGELITETTTAFTPSLRRRASY